MKYDYKNDGTRIHLEGRKFFTSKPVKNTDMVSFKAAKAFALFILYMHLSKLHNHD